MNEWMKRKTQPSTSLHFSDKSSSSQNTCVYEACQN
jgi:hypothetical protein